MLSSHFSTLLRAEKFAEFLYDWLSESSIIAICCTNFLFRMVEPSCCLEECLLVCPFGSLSFYISSGSILIILWAKLVLEMTYINQNVDTGIIDSQLFYVSFISKISSGNILIVLYKFWKWPISIKI